MRETPQAAKAYDDYWAMGDGRSLSKLAERYRNATEGVPTHQESRLHIWSQQHGWQARVRAKQDEQAAAADERRQQLIAGVEQQLLNDGIELQALIMGLTRNQAGVGRLSQALAPLLAQARGMAMRGLRQPETINRTEQTGADGGAMKVQQAHDVSFDFDAFAAAFADAAGVAAPGSDDLPQPVDPAVSDR